MIERLALSGLGVIDRAEVEVGPGLTVVTGETGAGKTMVLTGLGLLLGERADAGSVRRGAGQAEAEGTWRITDPDLRARIDEALDQAGGSWDDGDALIVARSVSAQGRSRAHLGGRSVPAATLADLGRDLVAVHGQDDQGRLAAPSRQRALLDRFGGAPLAGLLADYQAAHAALIDALARRADVVDRAAERAREAAYLADLLAAVAAVDPVAGEDEALHAEAARLAHVEEIGLAVGAAGALLQGGDPAASGQAEGAVDLLAQAERELRRAADRDPALTELADLLAGLAAQAGEAAVDLARYRDVLAADPGRLAAIEERRATLAALRRRLAVEIGRDGTDASRLDSAAILDWAERAESRLAEVVDDEARVGALDAEVATGRQAVGGLAGRLRAARIEAAQRLAGAVTLELAALAMPRARLEVAVRLRRPGEGLVLDVDGEPAALDRWGADEVEFLLASTADEPARALGRGASGGERSRIMLALEVVLADADPVPTMVFDEVDAGVGGRAAVEVGRRLARLARSAQVIVVTHLPQVAAFATRHLVVRATDDGRVISSGIEAVTGESRARELARMLAGLEDSDAAVAHAAELMALAEAEWARTPTRRPRTGSAAAGR